MSALFLVAGCGAEGGPVGGGGSPDLAGPGDASASPDAAAPADDLSGIADSSIGSDSSFSEDLASGDDLSPSADLLPAADLTTEPEPDLSEPDLLTADLSPEPDLSEPDLSPAEDLSPAPDLSERDLTPAPDLKAPALAFTGANATARVGNTSGGTSYDDACPAGQALIGFTGYLESANSYLGQITALCGTLTLEPAPSGWTARTGAGSTLATHGNKPNVAFQVSCPADQVIVGFRGRGGLLVDQLLFRCAPLTVGADLSVTVGATTDLAPVGGSGGSAFAQTDCPAGQVATVSRPRAGDGVDAFGLACSVPSVQ